MSKPVMNSHQPSITEWLVAAGNAEQSEAFRKEDNAKSDRLEILFQTIGAPYERPLGFEARELFDKSPKFAKYLEEHGEELCAIRLVPKSVDLPKLRQRGLPLRCCYEDWFLKQQINHDSYIAEICPHSDVLLWSAIFLIGADAIYGEVIRGMHAQLTHGETTETLYQFRYDFTDWTWSENDAEAEAAVQKMTNLLHVPSSEKRERLQNELDATFSHEYLEGYFESTVWPTGQTFLIDYNRILPRWLTPPPVAVPSPEGSGDLRGSVAHPGVARGIVRVVDLEHLDATRFDAGDILVSDYTDVRCLPLMKLSGAIVTDRGGTLSHAAIVARELKKPCIIGTKNATKTLHNGDEVEVDATKGTVKILKRA